MIAWYHLRRTRLIVHSEEVVAPTYFTVMPSVMVFLNTVPLSKRQN